jgi:hypothetical protein
METVGGQKVSIRDFRKVPRLGSGDPRLHPYHSPLVDWRRSIGADAVEMVVPGYGADGEGEGASAEGLGPPG